MTPDERDRLTRTEEQLKSLREDFAEAKTMLAEATQELKEARKDINQLRAAFGAATAYTKGKMWMWGRVVSVTLAFLGAGAWLADRIPAWLHK